MKVRVSKGSRGWGVEVIVGGRVIESYVRPSIVEAAKAAAVLLKGGEPVRASQIVDDDPSVLEVDNLLKLHLKEIRAALLEAAELQAPEADRQVIGIGLEAFLEFSNGDSGVVRVHDQSLTDSDGLARVKIDPPSGICTPQEVAAELKVSRQTVVQWYKDGKIPAITAEGSVYRFDLAEVKEALANRAKPKKGTRPSDRTRGGAR